MTSSSQSPNAPVEDVDVLIVGGGGAGLTASMLLSKLGVEHLLVSALPTTSILPKAHVLNQRTMEILEDAGVAHDIAARSTPAQNMATSAFYAGLAGSTEDHGRLIAKIECWGAGGEDENWRAASAWRQLNLPQIRLEPVLKDHAEALAPGRIRFGHELTALEQDGAGSQCDDPRPPGGHRVHGPLPLRHRRRRRTHRPRAGRHLPRRPWRRDRDRDAARLCRLLGAGR